MWCCCDSDWRCQWSPLCVVIVTLMTNVSTYTRTYAYRLVIIDRREKRVRKSVMCATMQCSGTVASLFNSVTIYYCFALLSQHDAIRKCLKVHEISKTPLPTKRNVQRTSPVRHAFTSSSSVTQHRVRQLHKYTT